MKKSKQSTRRGVSEMIAAMIVLLVSLVASVTIYNLAITSFNQYSDDYTYQIETTQQRIEERFTVTSIYKQNKSYTNLELYVDTNISDIDGSPNRGYFSDFPAQQGNPETSFDTLVENNVNSENIEDSIDVQSNIDGSSDIGSHSNFESLKIRDGMDTLMEEGIILVNSDQSYSSQGENSHNFDYALQTPSGQNRLVVVTVSFEDSGTDTIESCRFNGEEMILVDSIQVGSGYSEYVGLWYLLDSDLPEEIGYYPILVTASGSITREIWVGVSEYRNVNQTSYYDKEVNTKSSSGDISIDLNPNIDGSLIIACAGQGGTADWNNVNNIENLQTFVLTSSGSALGHQMNVNSGSLTLGWDDLSTRSAIVGAVWSPIYEIDLEVQFNDVNPNLQEEYLCIFTGDLDEESIFVDYWSGTNWSTIDSLIANDWNNFTINLSSDVFTIRFRDPEEDIVDTTQSQWDIDIVLLHLINQGDPSYKLDLEIKWDNVDVNKTNEELCIKCGSFDSEGLSVTIWGASGWSTPHSLESNKWNNISVSLTSNPVIVRFLGMDEANDFIQDTWNIYATLLHLWEENGTFVYIYNYGMRYIEIDKVYVDGEEYSFSPSDLLISVGDINQTTLDFSAPNSGNLVIVTKRGTSYETYYEP
jgi:hypothetical protein